MASTMSVNSKNAWRSEGWSELRVHLPITAGAMVSKVHDRGEVLDENWADDGWHATVRVPVGLVPELEALQVG